MSKDLNLVITPAVTVFVPPSDLREVGVRFVNVLVPIVATAVAGHVLSLAQFYSVDFLESRIGVKSGFSTNAQSRFASIDLDSVLGPPRLA